jgi:small GTP-binding protein
VEGKNIKMQLWDTAGQERYKTITQTYYKGAMGIVLVYDCTDETSFTNVRNWVKQIEQHANPGVPRVLVANKIDLPERKITPEEGKQLADEC